MASADASEGERSMTTQAHPDIVALCHGLALHRTHVLAHPALEPLLPPGIWKRMFHDGNAYEAMERLVLQMTAQGGRLEQTVMEIVEEHKPLRQDVYQPTTARSTSVSSAPGTQFAEPAVFEGRDEVVNQIIDIILAPFKRTAMASVQDPVEMSDKGDRPSPVIIYGGGGMGKSSVALAVLCDDRVRYLEHRFFVRCDGLKTLEDLLARLVRDLGIVSKDQQLADAVITFLRDKPVILVLDNFEDLCPDGAADGVEDFLSHLAGLSTLIITKRGSTPGLALPRSQSFDIYPLDLDAGRTAFLAYARHSGGMAMERSADLDALLGLLEGYPLAISLLARRVAPGMEPRQLLIQYEVKRADLMRRGNANSRETSLAASIQVSLQSRLMQETEGALEGCFLLSLLPDGAHLDLVLEAIFGIDPSGTSAAANEVKGLDLRSALMCVGLASYQQESGLLRMIAPLREYFSTSSAVEPWRCEDITLRISSYLLRLAKSSTGLFEQISREESLEWKRKTSAQLANMSYFIEKDIRSTDRCKVKGALDAACSVAEFIQLTVPVMPSFLQEAVGVARKLQLPEHEADCLRSLGDLALRRGNLEGAASHVGAALVLFRSIDHRLGEANCRKSLGNLALRRDDLEGAASHLEAALTIFQSIDERLGQANCLKSLGNLALQRDNLEGAASHVGAALVLFRSIDHRLGEANCRKSLGNLALWRDDLEGAASHLEAALTIFQSIDERLGQANCLQSLGNLALRRDNLEGAASDLEAALAIFQSIDERLGQANCRKSLGNLALRRDNLEGAASHLEAALTIFQSIDERLGQANCRKSLGNLALRRDNLEGAASDLEAALATFRSIDNRLGEVNCRKSLGNLALRRDDLEGAASHLEAALTIFQSIDERLGQANCLTSLGDLALLRNDLEGAASHLEAALMIFQSIDDRLGEANCLESLGDLARRRDDLEGTASHLEAALAIFRSIDHRLGEGNCLKSLGDLALRCDDLEGAASHLEAALAIFRSINEPLGEANCLKSLGKLAQQDGQVKPASRSPLAMLRRRFGRLRRSRH